MTTKVTPSALEKGLNALEQLATGPADARSAELFKKSQAGTITEEEKAELIKSLAGGSIRTAVLDPVQPTDEMKKALDVSGFLNAQHKGLTSALEAVADQLQKSETRTHEFNVALATSVLQIGKEVQEQGALMKAMSEKVGVMVQQPARAPKAVSPAQPINKSMGGPGQQAAEDNLSKSQIQDTMDDMLSKGMGSVAGEDLLQASTKYESVNMISKSLLEAVVAHRKTTMKSKTAA